MANLKSKDCLVGLELVGDRLRLAAFTGVRSDSDADGTRRLHCEEFTLADAGDSAPQALPSAASLAALLKTKLGRLGIGGGQAALAIDGRRMALRYSVGSDGEVRVELQRAIERSVNYIQFGAGDRLVGDHLHRMNDGRTHGLLGVSAANMIDPLTKALEQVGLLVKTVEPALVALTRMASISGQLNGKVILVVLVDEEGVEIGVVSDGHLLFSRRSSSAPRRAHEADAPTPTPRLPEELARISRHYERAFGAAEEMRQIILCGPADLVRPHAQALEDSPDFRTDLLRINGTVSTTLAVAADDLAEKESHTIALGAAVGLMRGLGQIAGPNLTSEPVVPQRSLLEGLIRLLLWPTLIALGLWGLSCFGLGQLEANLAKLRIEVDHPSPVQTRYRELQLELTRTERRTVHLGELVKRFENRNWTSLLEMIRTCAPEQLWLGHVRLTDERTLGIEGAAYEESLVYQFRKDLEAAPLFESATIATTMSSRLDNTIVIEFSLECIVFGGLPEDETANQ